MSLRGRLAFIYVLLAAPALAVFGVAVYVVARDRVYDSVDRTLANRAHLVTSSIGHVFGPLTQADIDSSMAALDRLSASGDSFVLFDASGQPIYSTEGLGSAGPLDSDGGASRYSIETTANERIRIYRAPIVRVGTTAGAIEVRTSLAQADDTLADLRWILILGGITASGAIALPAYALAGKALEPVSRASNLARDIEQTGDFSRRMPEVNGGGDLADLTRTLNSLIVRVDQMMKAQRAFLADSSHELRRPLTIIRTNIDVINDPRLSPEERQSIELEMREEAQSMSRLIADLHLLAREQLVETRFEPFDLSKVCEATMESILRHYGHLHDFEAEIPPAVQFIGDSDRIERAIVNLLENACIYTPSRGTIRLRLLRTAKSVQVVITDTGIGLSEEDAARVFERFYRARGSQAMKPDGFGLGLAIVKQIVEAHEGTIRLRSTPGMGSSFLIELPKSETAVPVSAF